MKNLVLVNEELNKWCGTEGVNYYEGDTALGFLFKYAVPKLYSCELETLSNLGEEGYEAFVNYGKLLGSEGYSARDKDPALALCLAISKMITSTEGEG